MVGVPRSKGCRICVQRRVKCDLTRPICNNCKKGNRPCPGYNQDLKFQDEGARLRRRFENHDSPQTGTESSRESTDSPPDSQNDGYVTFDSQNSLQPATNNKKNAHGAPIDDSSLHWDVVGLDMSKSQRRTFLGLMEGKSEAYLQLGQEVSDPFFPDGLADFPSLPFYEYLTSPESMQNQLITTFTKSLYPDNNTTVPPYLKSGSRWLAHLPPLTGTNALLDSSVRAVTLVHIGRLNNSEPFVMESRPYYGKALRLLNKALQDRHQGMQNETLCAVILLSFYEMFASDNNESWVRHAGGVSALMRARGSARHRRGLDREVFLAYRYMLIVESFQEDVPCFLAAPDWQKLSRDIHDDLKSTGVSPERMAVFDLAEDFYQAMVIVPEQTANARAVWTARQNGTKPPFSRPQVIEKMAQTRAEFKNTFTKFESALKKAGNAPTITLSSRDPLIGIEYEFANTFASATFTGYWTVLIVMNLCLQGLQAEDKEMAEMYRTESKECALHICRATASMLTSSFLGPFFIIFGLRVGLLVFEDLDGPESDWILRKLFEIGDRHMGIAKHVPGYRPGISVEELIAEFKEKKAASKQNDSESEQKEFQRNVAHGQIFGQQQQQQGDINDGSETNGNNNNDYRIHFDDINNNNGSWQGLTQMEDVMNAWDGQDNFPIHEMSNLNFSTAEGTSSGGPSSKHTSPTPPPPGVGGGGQNQGQYAVPDMGFGDPTAGWDPSWDEFAATTDQQQQQQQPEYEEWKGTPQPRPPPNPDAIGIARFFRA